MTDFPSKFKVHILYDFVEGPWGGGNQFLKALRKDWRRRGIYTDNPRQADVVLFNSFNSLFEVIELKRANPETIFVHRIDGPISKVRGWGQSADARIYHANRVVADGTVFQSTWSKSRNLELGMTPGEFTTTVLNAPDPEKFNPEGKAEFTGEPIKLIATSWSDNFRKGFDIYNYLDENLNFGRYQFTFVGKSPVEFDNIEHVDPVPPEEVADFLKEHDIFITASRNDPCSNSLIEALHCDLPAVAVNDGGHPEIVGNGGVLFEGKDDVVQKVDKLVNNYEQYRENIDLPDIHQVGKRYGELAFDIYQANQSGDYEPKQLSKGDVYLAKATQIYLNERNRVENLLGRAHDWIVFRLGRRV